MTTNNRSRRPDQARHAQDERHVMDYVRTLYKRRWVAAPVFILLFAFGAVNALREVPVYQARTQLLIDTNQPKVARLDQMFENGDGFDDEFLQTQYRILQSRSLARRAVDLMNLWDAPRLGNGPEPREGISVVGLLRQGVSFAVSMAASVRGDATAKPAPVKTAEASPSSETAAQSERIDEFLSGVSVAPFRGSQIVEVRYSSTDPDFAAAAANGVAKAYIQQALELRFSASRDAADFLSEQLAQQRAAVEQSEAALQAFRERNGAVSAADNASNIVVARLTDLNTALTRAKTERINKEALYNQLKAADGINSLDTFPAVLGNDYIQKLKTELADLQRQQLQLAERYGERHAEMIKIRSAIQLAENKLKAELANVVESVRNAYQASLAEERSLQEALDAQKSEALQMNRKGIEYSVLQRELESNREVYQSLLQQTKETGISKELRTSNVHVVDEAVRPGSPVSPNIPRALMLSLMFSLAAAVGIAFVVEQLDNRIQTPQELKAYLGLPFLGLVPSTPKDLSTPLVSGDAPPNFSEAFRTVRTNVLFSSSEDGLRSLVVTSAGPGEGKSIVAANLSITLAQAGRRVLLIDADMRRPRVHEIFDKPQEPGLSNILAGNLPMKDAIQRTPVQGLWLLSCGHIPPNPAELLGSHRWLELIASLEEQFDYAIIDSPPVLAVADSSVAANRATGVVFVVGSDKTGRQAARAAVEQLEAANAHIVGAVLNRVNIEKHPFYYASYYRKEYSKYYVKA